MALPKMIAALDAKLDRILQILEAPMFPIAETPEPTGPIDPETLARETDYDTSSVKQIIDGAAELSKEERSALHVYEVGHKNRPNVLKALAT